MFESWRFMTTCFFVSSNKVCTLVMRYDRIEYVRSMLIGSTTISLDDSLSL